MPLTRDYYRYEWTGTCNIVASSSSNIAAASDRTCAVGANSLVYTWNVRTALKTSVLEGSVENSYVTCVKFSPKRDYLAVGSHDGTVRIFVSKIHKTLNDEDNDDDNAARLVLSGHRTAVKCLAYSHDSLNLASGGLDTTIIIWDLVNECGLYKLLGHKNNITCLQFSVDDKYLVSSSKDTFIKFWSLDTQSCIYTLADIHTELNTFLLLRNDSRLLVGSSEMELKYYEVKWFDHSQNLSNDYDDYEEWCQNSNQLAVKPIGSLLRSAKGRCHQLCTDETQSICIVVGTGSTFDIFRIYTVEESKRRLKKKLLKAKKKYNAEQYEELFDQSQVETLIREDISIEIQRIGQHKCEAKVRSVDFGPSTDTAQFNMMCLLSDNQITSLNIEMLKGGTECLIVKLPSSISNLSHRTLVRGMALSNDQFSFATGSTESIKIWHRNSMSCTATIQAPDAISALLFISNDSHIVAATKSGHLYLFDIVTKDLVEHHADAHEKKINSMHVSPTGQSMITASHDKNVKVWQFELRKKAESKPCLTLRHARTLQLNDEANMACYSANGKYILVALLNNTACVFFEDSFNLFLSLYGHSLPVLCLDSSADGKLVITGSADKNIKLWGLDFGDCHKSLFAHDDAVTCVQFVGKSHNFFSAGKDGRLKHWDGDKFLMIQEVDAHTAPIWHMIVTQNGHFTISASDDTAILLWEQTDQIIVVDEELEIAREKQHDQELIDKDIDDIVPGELLTKGDNDQMEISEVTIASRRTLHGIKSSETILETLNVWRQRQTQIKINNGKEPPPHPLMQAYNCTDSDQFVIDVLSRVRSADMHKCLLMIPYSYAIELLTILTRNIERNYRIELCTSVTVFLLSIHQNQLMGDSKALHIVDILRHKLPDRIDVFKNTIAFNLAALELLRLEIEDNDEIQFFLEVHEKQKKKKKRKEQNVEQAYVMTLEQ